MNSFTKVSGNMKKNGRIAVIMAHVFPPMDTELLIGISEAVSLYGYDTILITGIRNVISDELCDDYSAGLENIYSLLEYIDIDGVIFAADRFLHDTTKNKILTILKKRNLPCAIIENKIEGFDCIYAPQREYIKMITEHLIQEHNCRKLYFFSGYETDPNSIERLTGFREAMDNAGLIYDDSCIFYGKYWHDIPKAIADDIADGKIEKPDGVVCANDEMATAFCEQLKYRGIKVPDDIAVTGYDGGLSGFFNDPPITTIIGHDNQIGSMAAEHLLRKLGHTNISIPEHKQCIRFGTSCGCGKHKSSYYSAETISIMRNIKKTNLMHQKRRDYISANMVSSLADCEDIGELMLETSKQSYLLSNWHTMEICMCDDWCFDFESPDKFRTEGYSENMLYMFCLIFGHDSLATNDFRINKLLPSLDLPHEPRTYVITPLHLKKQVFGYIGTSYENADDFLLDEYYVNWCDCVSNGMNNVQNSLYKNYLKQHFASLLTIDTSTGLNNKRGLMEKIMPFITSCGKENKKCAAIMLSYESKTGHYEISPIHAIANIFRDKEYDNKLTARTEDNMLACILGTDTEDKNEILRDFINNLNKKMKELYSGAITLNVDKIVSSCSIISGNSVENTENEIEKLIQKTTDKAKSMTFDVSDCTSHLNNARRRILESPQLDWNVDDIARNAGISKSYFQRLYREIFKTSCMEDIINARIDRAKRLLENTEMQIGDIAIECGYSNGSHFMRQFRQKTGVTAMEYRKVSRENTNSENK